MRSEACSLALIRQVEETTAPTSKPVPGGTELSCLFSLNSSVPLLGVVQSVTGRPLYACMYVGVFSSLLLAVVVVEVCCCTGKAEFDGERGCLLATPPASSVSSSSGGSSGRINQLVGRCGMWERVTSDNKRPF